MVRLVARLVAMLAICSLGTGCPRTTVVTDDPRVVVTTSASADAQAHFDAAVAHYEAGRFVEAADAFRLFGATYPADRLALTSELYLGRSLAAAGDSEQALLVFRSLSTAVEDRDLAELSAVYLAFVHGVRGEFEAGRGVLTPIVSRSGWRLPLALVIPGDEALVASIVAEAQIAAAEPVAALYSLEVVAVHAPDEVLLFYAYDRAVEVAETRMSTAELAAAFESGSVFAQAVCGAPLVAAHVASGDTERALSTLERAAGPMAELELTDRLAAAQSLLDAGTGGGQAAFGVVLSLTGPNRRAGRAALGGILLAQRAFGSASPAVIAHIRDTANDEDSTRAAVEELAALGVSAIIGPVEPELAYVARQAARDAGVPLVSLATDPQDEANSGAWRLQIDAGAEAAMLVREARSRGATRFVIVRADDLPVTAFTERVADATARAITDVGGELVDELAMVTSAEALQTSAEQTARSIARIAPHAVILALDSAPAAALGAWLAQQNVWASPRADLPAEGRIRVILAGSSFVASEELLRNSARYFEGALLASWFVAGASTGVAADFAARFELTYGREASVLDAAAFDAASLLRRLMLDEGRTTRARIAEGLDAVEGYDAVIGRIGFDGLGNPTAEPALVTVSGSVFVPVAP